MQSLTSFSLCVAVLPKHQSNILAGVKHQDELGARRAKAFLQKCDQIKDIRAELKKYGSFTEKDLSK